MKRIPLPLVLFALLFAACFVVLYSVFHPGAQQPAIEVDEHTSESSSPPPTLEGGATDAAARKIETPNRDSLPAPKEATRDPKFAVFRGRCVDLSGHPLAGVNVKLHAWRANRERMDAYLKNHDSVDWQEPDPQLTKDDGRFEFRVVPPPPYQFTLDLTRSGYITVSGRWGKVDPGSVKDFGDCCMEQGCVVRGRVIDTKGLPRAKVDVHLNRPDRNGGFDEDMLRPRQWTSTRTLQDGSFEMRHVVGAGAWEFDIRHERVATPDAKSVAIKPDERDRFFELTVTSKDDIPTIRGIVVDETGQPVRAQISTSGARGGWMIHSKRDGTFTIEREKHQKDERVKISAERRGYERVETEKAHPWGATNVRIMIRRGVSIFVMVTAASTGQPVEDYGVRIRQHGREWMVRSSLDRGVRVRGHHDNGRAELTGLRRGAYQIRIEPRDDRLVASSFRIVNVGEGHANEVRFQLTPAVHRILRVVTADRKPVSGTKVELLEAMGNVTVDLRTFAMRFDGSSTGGMNKAAVLHEGATGADGEIVLRGPGKRALAVRILGPGHLPHLVREVVLDSGTDPIVVVVKSGATVFGRIRPVKILQQMRAMAGENRYAQETKPGLRFSRNVGNVDFESFPSGYSSSFPVNDDGTFEVGGIAAGTWDLKIQWHKGYDSSSCGSMSVALGKVTGLHEGERRKHDIDASEFLFATVKGRVFLNGEPFVGQVSFFMKNGGDSTRSDKEGRFRAVLSPGSYRVQAKYRLFAAETLVVTPGQEVEQDFHFASVTLRVRLLGPDDKPRAGVRLLLHRDGAGGSREQVSMPASDKNGDAEAMVSPGSYEIKVMPKRLTTQAARMKFYEENQRNPQALQRALVPVATIGARLGDTKRIDVKLPAAAGY